MTHPQEAGKTQQLIEAAKELFQLYDPFAHPAISTPRFVEAWVNLKDAISRESQASQSGQDREGMRMAKKALNEIAEMVLRYHRELDQNCHVGNHCRNIALEALAHLDETPTPESQWPTEAIEAFKSCVTFIEEITDREIVLNWSGLEKVQAAIQWLRTSGVREGTRERENQWCDNDMKNALSEHYPGTDIDDYFKTWIVNYKK